MGRKRIRLGVIFGGQSCEHEVSVTSARSMLAALDQDRYDVTLIGISKDGRWQLANEPQRILEQGVVEGPGLTPVTLQYPQAASSASAISTQTNSARTMDLGPSPANELQTGTGTEGRAGGLPHLDVIFPLLHGPYGEDGTVQGLLELAGIAYVGCDVVGAAVGMDKQMMKRAFRAEGLPMVAHLAYSRHEWVRDRSAVLAQVDETLGFPIFAKPCNLGSSVGVSRADDIQGAPAAIDLALQYDNKVLIEAAALDCREIECAVLGNEAPEASVLGEIVPPDGFYDYRAKYVDDTARLVIPAELSERATQAVRSLAIEAFKAINGQGLARVDFFVKKDESAIFINEINTMPGFTPISMYPKLWAKSGLDYSQLIDRLIDLALERQASKRRLVTALD